jgi:hypothetical protein
MSDRLHRAGVSAELPLGWSGRLWTRPGALVTLHAASFPLPLKDGEFGDRSTGLMPAGGAFVAVTEYGASERLVPGVGLFAAPELPLPLVPLSFSPRRLQHARAGQTGAQAFFTASGRPMCAYVVLSSVAGARRRTLARHPQWRALQLLLGSLQVGSR